MNVSGNNGILDINGIEVRYTPASNLFVGEELKFIDIFGLLDFISHLSLDKVSNSWDPPNLLLTGPKGNGKSLLFAYLAQKNDLPYLSLDCSEGTRDRHLKGGYIVNSSGSTPFVLGTISNAIQVANENKIAMLVLEELNALSPQLQKDVNALTDFRKKIEVPELSHRFALNPGCKLFVCATMNPAVYGGTYELNQDLKSRFIEIEVPYPSAAAERQLLRAMTNDQFSDDILGRLVDIAQQTRQDATGYALSPRDLLQILNMIPRVGWDDALFLLAQKFNEVDRLLVIDRIKDITRTSICGDLSSRMASTVMRKAPF